MRAALLASCAAMAAAASSAAPRPMVDPATPLANQTTVASDGTVMKAVFTDEFNTDGRNFAAGADPYWEAIDHYNPTTGDMEYYEASRVTTGGGSMVITADKTQDHGHPFSSGMLSSWNQFCFTGGVVEVRLQLPGDPSVQGFWPAVWMMGNLARAGYAASTDRLWPWSYNTCDGVSGTYQKISKCNVTNSSWDMTPQTGRGAPEFDIVEANLCPTKTPADLHRCPNDTTSSGPFKEGPRLFSTMHFTPKNPANKKYTGIEVGDQMVTHENIDGDGLHDFLGVTSAVDPGLWTGMHTYRFEWDPTHEGRGGSLEGHVRWELDGKLLGQIHASTLAGVSGTGTNGDKYTVGDRAISLEPMYLIFNIAVADYWKTRDPSMQFPGKMQVDYVRVFQDPSQTQASCDPPDMPTAAYIKANPHLFDGTPMPPGPATCNPTTTPPQMCPGGKACPKCGKPSCACPKMD